MRKPIADLDAAEQVMRTHLNSPGATALRTAESWTYVPPSKGLRRKQPVVFPPPPAITVVDEAERWASLAEDVAAETKSYFAASLLILAFLLSLLTLPLTVNLSTMLDPAMDPAIRAGAKGLAVGVAVVALVAMPFFAHGPRQAPVWERRAVALRVRAHELAATQARLDEQETAGAAPPRSWWRCRRR